jgi:hypothetical protein
VERRAHLPLQRLLRDFVVERYWIPEYVHVCILKDIVWLDERTQRYLTIDGGAGPILAQVVHGWPRTENPRETLQFTNDQREALVSNLLTRGLLSKSLGNGRRYTPLKEGHTSEAAELVCSGEQEAVRWHQFARCAFAFARVKGALRVGGLRFVIASVARKRTETSVESIDENALSTLLSAFRRLRLLFYSPRRNCLLDSLVLLFFLRPYGIVPKMVFGVAARPFHAHCWLEWNGIVLNGGADVASLHRRIREV